MSKHVRVSRAIAAELRVEILSGHRRAGAQLPTTGVLMERYGVARQTVQNAVNDLKDEGLVESRPGVGWFICALNSLRLVRSSTAWLDRNARVKYDHARDPWRPEIKLNQSPVPASRQVAWDLGLAEGMEVWLRQRTIANNNRVFQVGRAYLPREITKGTVIETPDSREGGTYAELRELGHWVVRFTETVCAAPATPAEANALGLSASSAPMVIRITRIAHGASRPLEVDYIVARSARLELVYELPAE